MAETTRRIDSVMPRKTKPSHPFGERLVRLRAERGLTQAELAERLGCTQSSISTYETVTEYPPTAMVVAMAKELKVSTDELLGMRPQKGPLRDEESTEVRRLWKQFQKVLGLPERDRRAVIRLVNSLQPRGKRASG